jgi:uncharacterized membrane protein YbhN (UPF0104 family)
LKVVLRWGFVALTIAFLGYALSREWHSFVAALQHISGVALVFASVAVAAGLVVNMLSWRESIAAVAQTLPIGAASRVYFLSQLGKYVPGSVWPVLAQAAMGRAHGISRVRSAIGSVLAMLVGLASAVFVASTVLLFLRRDALAQYWWLGLVAVACVVALLPPVLRRLLVVAMRLRARGGAPEEVVVSTGRLVRALGWAILLWLLLGVQTWLIAGDLVPHATNLLAWSTGAFALAWAVGFVIVLAPGGLGAREIALAFALSSVMQRGDALALALISRVLMTIGDLAAAGLAVALTRAPANDDLMNNDENQT